jgi:hypothetical protein
VPFSLPAGKKPASALEICPLDVENPLSVSALNTIVAGRPAAEFCMPFREQNGLGSGSAGDFGMGPAGCLFAIGNSFSN